MSVPVLAVVGVIVGGLLFGSFFNAFVWRFLRSEKITAAHSICVHCHHALGLLDLIPVLSFLFLGGRCRYCKRPIPWHYPVVEIATVGVLVAPLFVFGLSWRFAAAATLGLVLELLFLLDLRYSLLPDAVTLPGILLAFGVGLAFERGFEGMLIGGILGAGFFALQYLVSRGAWIGSGDIRLGALMGLALGWQLVLLALLLAYVAGAVVGLGLLASKRKNWESKIPFGTFLSAATYVVLLWGPSLAHTLSGALLFPNLPNV